MSPLRVQGDISHRRQVIEIDVPVPALVMVSWVRRSSLVLHLQFNLVQPGVPAPVSGHHPGESVAGPSPGRQSFSARTRRSPVTLAGERFLIMESLLSSRRGSMAGAHRGYGRTNWTEASRPPAEHPGRRGARLRPPAPGEVVRHSMELAGCLAAAAGRPGPTARVPASPWLLGPHFGIL